MLNIEQAIAVIQEESRRLEFLLDYLKSEYRYYGATLDALSPDSDEYKTVLGAFLAIEQILKANCNLFFDRYCLKQTIPNDLASTVLLVEKHFPRTYYVVKARGQNIE